MLLQRDSENSKTSEGERIITLSPPELQTLHKYMESVKKISNHFPREGGKCGCGYQMRDVNDWAEHLTELLFKKP